MKTTQPDLKEPAGPTERPDDPLAAATRRAAVSPLPAPRGVDRAKRTAPPTPDQEGCYYLG